MAAALTEAKPRAIYGPEPWQHDGEAAWSHRDLWFCLVARRDHDGNLAVLADTIEGQHERSGRDDAEAKISHLDDLVDRLALSGRLRHVHKLAASSLTTVLTATKASFRARS